MTQEEEAEFYRRRTHATTEQLSVATVKEPTKTTATEQLSADCTVDEALTKTRDLINPNWKAWYAKQAYRHGTRQYLSLAEAARRQTAISPPVAFSKSLKTAL